MSSATLERWDKQHVWHPFTQQSEWARRKPVIIQSGRGVWLRDTRGRRLLDGNSSLWVNVWGHRRPELDRALTRQIGKISHATFLGLTHDPAVRLARKLVELAPKGLSRVFYSDNGSTAVEVAVKMAYQYWQLKGQRAKTKFISLKDGYHGDTLGSVSVGGIDLFHERFRKLLFKGWLVDPPPVAAYPNGVRTRPLSEKGRGAGDDHSRYSRGRRRESIEFILAKHHGEIAAVIMEPLIQGASGMRMMPKGYLSNVARLCRKYNVLLIVDEVATGFGRTGKMFASEHENVSPDFLCVAKSITGGYLPLAATITKEAIFKAFLGRYDEFKTFFHGHTYTANPLACAVALENLKLFEQKSLLAHVKKRIEDLHWGLSPMKHLKHVKEIRQMGLMVGIELVADKATGRPYDPGLRMGLKVCDEAIRRRVWLRPLGDVIVLMPPLVISKKELAFLIDVVRKSVILVTHDEMVQKRLDQPRI